MQQPQPKSSKTNAANNWPQNLSFKAFKKFSPVSEDWVYKTAYALRGDQISVKNQRIGLIKLEKILNATFKISTSRGFDSMSLRELGAESGISMGGLYSYISSKEELANLIEHVLGVIATELIDSAIETITDTKQKLAALIRCHIFLSEQLEPWFYFVYMEAKTLSRAQKEKAKKIELDYESKVSDLIEQGIEEGVFQSVDISLTASVTMALMQDWYVKWWKHKVRKTSPDDYASFVQGLVMKQLGA